MKLPKMSPNRSAKLQQQAVGILSFLKENPGIMLIIDNIIVENNVISDKYYIGQNGYGRHELGEEIFITDLITLID